MKESETLEETTAILWRGMKAAESSSSGRSKVQSRIRAKKKMRLGKSSSPSPISSSSTPSSCRLLSVKNDISFYVRVVNIEDQPEWYSFVFNASDEDEERKRGLRGFVDYLPVPTPLRTKKISPFSSCAAVGSTMYCVGGWHTPYPGRPGRLSRKVHYLDTSLLPQPSSWPKGPSMLNARSRPCTVSLNGKLYVMGGIVTVGNSVSEPWAEVFDPKSQKWVPLPSPSPKPSDLGLFSAALHDSDKVVVGSRADDFVCLYNVRTECWERLDKERDYGPSKGQQTVAVGTTLFWFYDSKLHAYDLFGKRRDSGPINGLEDNIHLADLAFCQYTPALLHIAHGRFYWICFENCGHGLAILHCVKFRVPEFTTTTVHNDKGRHLNAFAESCQISLIRRPSSLILDAVLMFPTHLVGTKHFGSLLGTTPYLPDLHCLVHHHQLLHDLMSRLF